MDIDKLCRIVADLNFVVNNIRIKLDLESKCTSVVQRNIYRHDIIRQKEEYDHILSKLFTSFYLSSPAINITQKINIEPLNWGFLFLSIGKCISSIS